MVMKCPKASRYFCIRSFDAPLGRPSARRSRLVSSPTREDQWRLLECRGTPHSLPASPSSGVPMAMSALRKRGGPWPLWSEAEAQTCSWTAAFRLQKGSSPWAGTVDGVVSTRLGGRLQPLGQRGIWPQDKCLNREEFVVARFRSLHIDLSAAAAGAHKPSRQSGTAVSAPYRSAISAGSGST
jgi:hypothetical protein